MGSVPACAPAQDVPSWPPVAVRVAPNSAPRPQVLSRANRLRDSGTIRQTLRQGKRSRGNLVSTSAANLIGDLPSQVAFIVPKAVGNSVQRNLVKRRLRSIARPVIINSLGITFVIRANSGCYQASFAELEQELTNNLVQLRDKLSGGAQP